MLRPLCASFVLALAVACAPDAPSTCYAPAAYTYRSEIRKLAELPDSPIDAFALPDGRAVAVTIDDGNDNLPPYQYDAYLIDPEAGTFDHVAAWEGEIGRITRLADGRLLVLELLDCNLVFVDLEDGTSERKACSGGDVAASQILQRSADEVLVFGSVHTEGVNFAGTVFSLDLATATFTRLDTAVDHGFATPPDAPFQLCDGRFVFPHTETNDDDLRADAPAVHYYDPAERELTSIDLSFTPDRAAQLDAGTALLIGVDDDGQAVAQVLDLDAQTLHPVGLPAEAVHPIYANTVVGLADGTALVLGSSGNLHRYSPDTETFTRLDLRFSSDPRRLLRLSTGAVLAFTNMDNAMELFE